MSRVGCAGILVADTFCGPMQTLPTAGQLLAVDDMVARAGGCAANVAIGLAKQGITSEVIGCVGDDAPAQVVIQALHTENVTTDQIITTDKYPTSQTVILLVEGEDRRYIHAFGANQAFSTDHLNLEQLKQLDVFYLGGLFLMPALNTDSLRDVFKFCQENKVKTVLDVVLPHYHQGLQGLEAVLPYVDYFLPNDYEAEKITGEPDPIEQIKVLRQHGANQVIITQGESGVVTTDGDNYLRCGAYSVESIDPSGGGDAFAAGFITGIVNGWDTVQSLEYGAALGASCTLKIGTTDGVFTSAEAEDFIASHDLTIERIEM